MTLDVFLDQATSGSLPFLIAAFFASPYDLGIIVLQSCTVLNYFCLHDTGRNEEV